MRPGPKPTPKVGYRNCERCTRWRPISDFSPVQWWPDGTIRQIHSYCRPCDSARQREYAKQLEGEKLEKRRKRQREWMERKRRERGILPREVGNPILLPVPRRLRKGERIFTSEHAPAKSPRQEPPPKRQPTPDLLEVFDRVILENRKATRDYIEGGILMFGHQLDSYALYLLSADAECEHGRLRGDRLDGLAPNWPHTHPCGCYPDETAPSVDGR